MAFKMYKKNVIAAGTQRFKGGRLFMLYSYKVEILK